MSKRTQQIVLLVDDNPNNLALLFDALRQVGYRVLTAEDGQTALKRVDHIKPDIILLDVMMPILDGFQTCSRLKENPDTADIPVIFMTALSESVNEVRGFNLGAVDYIVKPFQLETVLARVKTHLTIRRLQQDLQSQVSELDAFSRTVAHDLKNPLSSIVSGLDFILSDFDNFSSADAQELLELLRSSSKKAVSIVDELLLLAQVNRQNTPQEIINMGDVIHQAHQRTQSMLNIYQGSIDLPAELPLVMGHTGWVEEVWVNYMTNAIKYGGKPPHMELGNDPPKHGQVRFWVKDNGEGLSEEQQGMLFTEFTRLRDLKVEGHGLGLSIVRRIITKLGGQVGVESTLGAGSLFYFTLPQADLTDDDNIL